MAGHTRYREGLRYIAKQYKAREAYLERLDAAERTVRAALRGQPGGRLQRALYHLGQGGQSVLCLAERPAAREVCLLTWTHGLPVSLRLASIQADRVAWAPEEGSSGAPRRFMLYFKLPRQPRKPRKGPAKGPAPRPPQAYRWPATSHPEHRLTRS